MNAAESNTDSELSRLFLYVTGDSPRSQRARSNLSRALEQNDLQEIPLEVIDVLHHPEKILAQGIFATPALICDCREEKMDILYGDLSDKTKLQDLLDNLSACQ